MLKIEEYVSIKNKAYRTVSFFSSLSDNQKFEFIQNVVPFDQGTDQYTIYVHTLLCPDDVTLLNLANNTKDINQIAKTLGSEIPIIAAKLMEARMYHLAQLINSKQIDYELANQTPSNDDEEIDKALCFFFPGQPYIEGERKQREENRQKIIGFTK